MAQLTPEEIEIVVSARDLLSDVRRWCTGATAADAAGNRVKPTDPRACWWCAIGAIAKESPGGLIPYRILRHIDECFPLFEPILSRDWGFEKMHDEVFDHDRLMQWFTFILAQAQPTPLPEPLTT